MTPARAGRARNTSIAAANNQFPLGSMGEDQGEGEVVGSATILGI